MPQTRLHALHRVLRGLVERPEPGLLVVACTDHEIVYLTHALDRLDEDSPADRFCTLVDPFKNADDFFRLLGDTASAATDRVLSRLDPHTFIKILLDDLPTGDHRLVLALLPTAIEDRPGFTALAGSLLAAPLDPRLRLVLRDDRTAPLGHFEAAARSTSEQLLAYRFELSPGLILEAVAVAAHDRERSPNERAQALLQLACTDLGQRRHADAIARCRAVARLPAAPSLQAFALALIADVHRRSGDLDAALTTGAAALELAVDATALPVVQHAALALGDLTRELGRTGEAIACFALAERSAALNPEVEAHARAQRVALERAPC